MSDAPWPLMEVAIEPRNKIAAAQLGEALPQLAAADPFFVVGHDPESGQTIIRGMSEAHLESKVLTLTRTYEVAMNVGPPQVAYRETLTDAATIKYTYKKVTGGAGEFAEVTIKFEPLPRGSSVAFENAAVDGTVPADFIPAVESGFRAQAESGLLAGFPMIDVKATLLDGKYHEMDSNALAFNIAARAAFRELATKKIATLLEPVMALEVATPEDFLGGVIGDVNSRRGTVFGTENGIDGFQIVAAEVPLANLYGYGTSLVSMTQGRARFTMNFARYERVFVMPDDGGPDRPFPGAMGMRVA